MALGKRIAGQMGRGSERLRDVLGLGLVLDLVLVGRRVGWWRRRHRLCDCLVSMALRQRAAGRAELIFTGGSTFHARDVSCAGRGYRQLVVWDILGAWLGCAVPLLGVVGDGHWGVCGGRGRVGREGDGGSSTGGRMQRRMGKRSLSDKARLHGDAPGRRGGERRRQGQGRRGGTVVGKRHDEGGQPEAVGGSSE